MKTQKMSHLPGCRWEKGPREHEVTWRGTQDSISKERKTPSLLFFLYQFSVQQDTGCSRQHSQRRVSTSHSAVAMQHVEAAEQCMPLKDSANVYKPNPENLYLPQLLLPALKTRFSGAKQEQFFP